MIIVSQLHQARFSFSRCNLEVFGAFEALVGAADEPSWLLGALSNNLTYLLTNNFLTTFVTMATYGKTVRAGL